MVLVGAKLSIQRISGVVGRQVILVKAAQSVKVKAVSRTNVNNFVIATD